MQRRDFLIGTAATMAAAAIDRIAPTGSVSIAPPAADYSLRIGQATIEIGPHDTVRTLAYNDTVPGPLIRVREGDRVTVNVVNGTADDEWVHWHGLAVGADVDGSMDEGTPPVPAHGARQYAFAAAPSGTRWYHTHRTAGHRLSIGGYTGMFGFFIIDPALNPARYDAEYLLALHDWNAYVSTSDDGYQSIRYTHATVNGRMLGAADPIRVRQGDRVLFRLLNASATDIHWVALPNHRFTVVALDGFPVATPAAVDVLRIAPAERVDAIVEMTSPGVWILGECDDKPRKAGMGVVIEYENQSGPPVWTTPASMQWNYRAFASPSTVDGGEFAEAIPLTIGTVFRGHGDFEHWSLNGKIFPENPPIMVRDGRRYRLVLDNRATTEDHPVHIHRHAFDIVSMDGVPISGVRKDVVVVEARRIMEVEFTADAPGKTLLHCHMQDHMDAGFMQMIEYGQP